ncbi:MAG: hypothetical protein DME24_12980 [Verrucomicrobia bacterium]|nr:MAG: hypothetical protein DME24_12980 [Verrucomicrobiota bacterium]
MNGTRFSKDALANASGEEMMSSLFVGLVVQQTNMALMLLGRMPHPETGQTMQDIESAKLFIDQLEMLEGKTRGNLDKQEDKLLKQSLTALRLAFVEAVESQARQPQAIPSMPASEPAKSAGPAKSSEGAGQPSIPPSDEGSRKKFSKKY